MLSGMPDKPQVPAADQTLRILALLGRSRGPVAASSIATTLGLPRSSVYHLLATMQEHGFVVHLPEQRRWGLGTAAAELAGGFNRQQPLARLGGPVAAALADRTGESTHIAMLTGRDVIYIVEERAPRRPALVTDVGVRLPAHLTATGRAMLAGVGAAQLRALYPDAASFSTRTERGPTTPRELRAHRRRGSHLVRGRRTRHGGPDRRRSRRRRPAGPPHRLTRLPRLPLIRAIVAGKGTT